MKPILVATWDDGLFVVERHSIRRELAGASLRGLTGDGAGGALAIVDGRSVRQRTRDGAWRTLAEGDVDLSCCLAVGAAIYVGTDDARVFAVGEGGRLEPVTDFAGVRGRESWYAGTAVVDGRVVGPPLGVRSMTATSDHGALLVNVHVGGIPRSCDGGRTWAPTIDVDADVHEVRAHPTRPRIVAAAAAVGLCLSRDGGDTWTIHDEGLHALHCSAVAFVGDDVLVSASTDPFSPDGSIYRRAIDGDGALEPLGGGLPRRLEGKCDTGDIGVRGAVVALADFAGTVHASEDAGRTWSRIAEGCAAPTGVVVC